MKKPLWKLWQYNINAKCTPEQYEPGLWLCEDDYILLEEFEDEQAAYEALNKYKVEACFRDGYVIATECWLENGEAVLDINGDEADWLGGNYDCCPCDLAKVYVCDGARKRFVGTFADKEDAESELNFINQRDGDFTPGTILQVLDVFRNVILKELQVDEDLQVTPVK